MNYWEECITEALEDAEIKATKVQIETLTSWVQGAHENYGMATGIDVASANWESDEAIELKRLKVESEKKRLWELNTKPCKTCTTSGSAIDGWGREITCPDCRGDGRI